MTGLESELGEEPLVLAGLVLLLQGFLDNLLGLFFLRWLSQCIWGNGVLEALNVQGVSGWHQVVVVHQLDKWLHLGSSSNLLGIVGLGDSLWSLLNAHHNGVGERVLLGSFVVCSHNDNLLTGVTTTGNNS